MQGYPGDRSAQFYMLPQKLLIKAAISPVTVCTDSGPASTELVLALNLKYQVPSRLATWIPVFQSLVWLDWAKREWLLVILLLIIMIMSIFLECLSMWNMLSCAEQVQIQKYKTHSLRHSKQVSKQSCWWYPILSAHILSNCYECCIHFVMPCGTSYCLTSLCRLGIRL